MFIKDERIIFAPFRRLSSDPADIDFNSSAVTFSSDGFLIPLYSATCGMNVEIRLEARFLKEAGTFLVDTAESISERNESNIPVDPNKPISEGVK